MSDFYLEAMFYGYEGFCATVSPIVRKYSVALIGVVHCHGFFLIRLQYLIDRRSLLNIVATHHPLTTLKEIVTAQKVLRYGIFFCYVEW